MRKFKAWVLLCMLLLSLTPAFAAEAFAASALAASALAADTIPAAVKAYKGGSQLVYVTAKPDSYKATLALYSKSGGKWKLIKSVSAVLGKNGLIAATDKREGDGCTPTGLYALKRAFGQGKPPKGTRISYKTTTKNDYWVDDPKSDDYNTWVRTTKNPKTLWESYEKLNISAYKRAVVVEYNTKSIKPGMGSAIFLHVWKGSSKPTAGCVAVSESNMNYILTWLNPSKTPKILIALKSK